MAARRTARSSPATSGVVVGMASIPRVKGRQPGELCGELRAAKHGGDCGGRRGLLRAAFAPAMRTHYLVGRENEHGSAGGVRWRELAPAIAARGVCSVVRHGVSRLLVWWLASG